MTRNQPNRRVRRQAARAHGNRTDKVRKSLHALTSSAVALGSWAQAQNARADSPIDRATGEYNFSFYVEDDVDSSKIAVGADERYEIKTHQFRMAAPISDRMDIGFEVMHESMSGASPWNVVDVGGNPQLIMSAASIDDRRTDVLANLNHYYDRGRAGFAVGFSTEKDYDALNLSFNGERHFNEKNTTLSAGLGSSFDRIDPTSDPAVDPTRPGSDDKQSYTLFGGVSQVLGRYTTLQSSLSYKLSTGYLSDPYKLSTVGGASMRDERPDKRHQFSWLTRYRHHFEQVRGSLHADYQFYIDDWDMDSHTIELAWYQSFFDFIRVIPSVRWYSQSEADFYDAFFPAAAAGGDHSSDYRLSGYGSLSYRIQGEVDFETPWTGDQMFTAIVGYERYESDEDYGHSESSTEAPGLVDFDVFTVGLRVRF